MTRFWETSLSPSRRQFYCADCQRYFTERLDFAGWERRYTHRYEAYIYQRVQSSSLEQIAREEALSFDQVQGIFNHQNAQKKTEDWGGVRRLSIDEISQRKGHKDNEKDCINPVIGFTLE